MQFCIEACDVLQSADKSSRLAPSGVFISSCPASRKTSQEMARARERPLEWMPVSKAVGLVQEPGMALLLRRLEEIEAAKAHP